MLRSNYLRRIGSISLLSGLVVPLALAADTIAPHPVHNVLDRSKSHPHPAFKPPFPKRSFRLASSSRCATNVPTEVSSLRGKIAFQRQTGARDTSDAKIYVYTLGSSTAPFCLNDNWQPAAGGTLPDNLRNTINPQFSLDGKRVIFGAISGAAADKTEQSNVIACNVDGSNLRKLAGSSQSRDEDPKFSPDGRSIIYKHNTNQIWIMNADGTNQRAFVNPQPSATERGMPAVTADGKTVVFTDAVGAPEGKSVAPYQNIYKCPPAGGTRIAVAATPDLEEYYPAPWTGGRILYTRWADVPEGQHYDQIYVNSGNTNIALPAPLNTSPFDSSDPAPINDLLLAFSSTRTGSDSNGTTKTDGTYDLYIGDASTGQIWSFQTLNPNVPINTTEQSELGAAIWLDTSAATIPAEVSGLKGKVAFQRQATTANASDAKIYVYDLGSQTAPICLNDKFSGTPAVKNTINPQISPDGTKVIFGGIAGTSPNDESDIFLCNIDGGNLRKLAGSTSSRDEDPRFSPDGRSIIYKHNKTQIWIMNADGSRQRQFVSPTPAATERSMPVVTPDGKRVLFTDSTGADSTGADQDIYSCPPAGGARVAIAATAGLREYRPTPWTSGRVLYTRWAGTATAQRYYQIYKVESGASSALPSPLNTSSFDSLDPAPVNDHLIVFSSNRVASDSVGTAKTDATYDLYIGNTITGQLWSFKSLYPSVSVNTTDLQEVAANSWVAK